MILCDATAPATTGGVYQISYIESVDGYRHGYITKHDGVRWTRDANHPADPRCPECSRWTS